MDSAASVRRRLLVYATEVYGPFLEALLLGAPELERGLLTRRFFPDGERYLRVEDDVDGHHVVLVAGTVSEPDTLELFDLASSLVKDGAESFTLICPWFGYATMERAVKRGEVVTAKSRARLLSAIPLARRGNRVLLLDLHAEGIPHYFEGEVRAVHVYGKPLVMEAARRLVPSGDFVLASTDAGRAKWVESLANDMHVPAAVVLKRRLPDGTSEIASRAASVEGKDVIVYDDMIRTGGSLLHAAKAYRDAGAHRLFALATHGLFPGDALDAIHASGLFEKLVVTDSHPAAMSARSRRTDGFLEVVPSQSLFLPYLCRQPENT